MRWPWPNDLGTQTWPRYGQDVTWYQKWSFYVNSFKSYSPNRQTDRHKHTHRHYENITSTAYAGGKKACFKKFYRPKFTTKLPNDHLADEVSNHVLVWKALGGTANGKDIKHESLQPQNLLLCKYECMFWSRKVKTKSVPQFWLKLFYVAK